MSRLWALNLTAACVALGVSLALGVSRAARPSSKASPLPALTTRPQVVVRGAVRGVLDASGNFFALRDYRRIAAASTLANELLLLLCEPDRIVGFAQTTGGQPEASYRFAGKPGIAGAAAAEALIALSPDLVLVNAQVAGVQRVERLRDAGLAVFDLGAMRGLRTLLPAIQTLGTLLGRPEVGAQQAERFERRMQRLAQRIPAGAWPNGMYMSLFGDTLSGGTDGTSYHDVLQAAGVRDVAAARYDDWPRLTPEAVLALDPELIVTHDGMAAAICAQPGLDRLRACASGRIVELDAGLLGDPGLRMLEAAELLFDRVHGGR